VVRSVLFVWVLIAVTQVAAQDKTSEWFPLDTGNQWVYQHEDRNVPARNPHITRWQTIETITGTFDIPAGKVVLRRVEVIGDTSGGWLQTVFGESNYLIRNSCLYFLDRSSWSELEHRLRPEYESSLLAGDEEPAFCFPLAVGKPFGKEMAPGWRPSRVVGEGAGLGFTPSSVSRFAFNVASHQGSGNDTHMWFEKGVGITGIWMWHNGTYGEYRVTLQRFSTVGAHPPVRPGQ
jgi:hypothetical protein